MIKGQARCLHPCQNIWRWRGHPYAIFGRGRNMKKLRKVSPGSRLMIVMTKVLADSVRDVPYKLQGSKQNTYT